MADYTNSKAYTQNTYPVESSFTSSLLTRIEPIITPELLKARYLIGVDLSNYSDDILKDRINLAMNEVELKLGVPLVKTQFKERLPFDRDLYRSFVYTKTNNGPILSVEFFRVESSNGENIFNMPPAWLEMGFAHKRQINLVPIMTLFGAQGFQDGQATNAGMIFLRAISNFQWMPSFYSIEYTAGVCKQEGQLPIAINELVGMTAAIEILSQIQNTFLFNSQSISQDGISQSSGGQGPQTYKPRIEKLAMDLDVKMKKMRMEFHQKIFMSNV